MYEYHMMGLAARKSVFRDVVRLNPACANTVNSEKNSHGFYFRKTSEKQNFVK